MSRLEDALNNDVKALEQLRDQLKAHANLLKAEAKERWDDLEKKRDQLVAKMENVQRSADAPRQELEAAARHLVDILKAGYADFKKILKD